MQQLLFITLLFALASLLASWVLSKGTQAKLPSPVSGRRFLFRQVIIALLFGIALFIMYLLLHKP